MEIYLRSNFNVKKYLFYILLLFLHFQTAIAANITSAISKNGSTTILIMGEISKGDFEKLQNLSAIIITNNKSFESPTFSIDTNGGDIEEALEIGRWLRKINASVLVDGKIFVAPDSEDAHSIITDGNYDPSWVILPSNLSLPTEKLTKAYSAGVLIFYGGAKRFLTDNFDRRFSNKLPGTRIPVIGVHRPYYNREYYSSLTPEEADKKYKALERKVREYLSEMGAPQIFIDDMFQMSSDEIRLVPDTEFSNYFKETEPYLEEWLIAKCGSIGEEFALTKDELPAHKQAAQRDSTARLEAAKKGVSLTNRLEISTMNEYESGLQNKVRTHNENVRDCQRLAIYSSQAQWAKEYVNSHKNIQDPSANVSGAHTGFDPSKPYELVREDSNNQLVHITSKLPLLFIASLFIVIICALYFRLNNKNVHSMEQHSNSIDQDVNARQLTANDGKSMGFIDNGPHPLRRYFAKLIDMAVFGCIPLLIISVLIAVLFPGNKLWDSLFGNQIYAAIILIIIWTPIDAFSISIFGSTLGKWIFGIKVLSKDGGKLSFSSSMERSTKVAVLGMGLGIPIISLITQYSAYKKLKSTGETDWDRDIQAVVTHSQLGFFRYLVCIFAIAVFFVLLSIIFSIGK